jgi:hypothetical protein
LVYYTFLGLRLLDCWGGFESRWVHGCDVYCTCVLCRQRPLWRADHSSGGVLIGVCVCVYVLVRVRVWYINLNIEASRRPDFGSCTAEKNKIWNLLKYWRIAVKLCVWCDWKAIFVLKWTDFNILLFYLIRLLLRLNIFNEICCFVKKVLHMYNYFLKKIMLYIL